MCLRSRAWRNSRCRRAPSPAATKPTAARAQAKLAGVRGRNHALGAILAVNAPRNLPKRSGRMRSNQRIRDNALSAKFSLSTRPDTCCNEAGAGADAGKASGGDFTVACVGDAVATIQVHSLGDDALGTARLGDKLVSVCKMWGRPAGPLYIK